MNKKYFYFGVRLTEMVVGTTGAPRKREVVRWNATCYPTAQEAASAACVKMSTHLGVSYFVQGFDRQLDISSDGESKGFKAE
jgi:hypothetical protein